MSAQLLSPEQQAIVDHWTREGGPMLVRASAGSGKTRVLTESARFLLESSPKAKYRILCLTFTNKAAEEMQTRLQLAPGSKQRLFIGTLHAFALDLLNARKRELGFEEMPHIIEGEADRKAILAQAIQAIPSIAHHYKTEEKNQVNLLDKCLRFISQQKRNLVWLDEETTQYADWSEERVSLYLNYNAYLRNQNLIDYDDILLLAWRVLSEHPRVAKLYRQLYHYIMVDEAQDLSFAQYELIKALCGDQMRNIMMVGDPKQAIHGYAGASSSFMENAFVKDFSLSEDQQQIIECNYRSSRQVIALANRLSGNGQHQLNSYFEGETSFHSFENEEAEAEWIVQKLTEIVGTEADAYEGILTLDKIAVLGRNRYVFKTLAKRLEATPEFQDQFFLKRGNDTLEPASNFMKVFDLGCRLIENPQGEVYRRKLAQLLALTSYEANDKDLALLALQNMLRQASVDWLTAGLTDFLQDAWQNLSKNLNSFLNTLDILISGLTHMQQEEERALATQDIQEWQEAWRKYIRSVNPNGKTIADFRRFLAMGGVQRREERGLTLATVHTVKGLEFHVIFLIGMGQGTFPDYRAVKSGQIREEQNNLYVAITRAKRDLYITYPQRKTVPWGEIEQKPSQFLAEQFTLAKENFTS